MIPAGIVGSARVASGGGDGALEYLTAASAPASATVHTFAGLSFGVASSDRTIVVALVTQTTVSAMTVGGVAATRAVEDTAGVYGTRAGVWMATVPTGATGDVVVTLGTAHDRCGVGLWRIGGAVTVSSTKTTAPLTLTTALGDYVVACRYVTTGTISPQAYKLAFPSGDSHVGGSTTATGTSTTFTTSGTGFSAAAIAFTLA